MCVLCRTFLCIFSRSSHRRCSHGCFECPNDYPAPVQLRPNPARAIRAMLRRCSGPVMWIPMPIAARHLGPALCHLIHTDPVFGRIVDSLIGQPEILDDAAESRARLAAVHAPVVPVSPADQGQLDSAYQRPQIAVVEDAGEEEAASMRDVRHLKLLGESEDVGDDVETVWQQIAAGLKFVAPEREAAGSGLARPRYGRILRMFQRGDTTWLQVRMFEPVFDAGGAVQTHPWTPVAHAQVGSAACSTSRGGCCGCGSTHGLHSGRHGACPRACASQLLYAGWDTRRTTRGRPSSVHVAGRGRWCCQGCLATSHRQRQLVPQSICAMGSRIVDMTFP